MTPAPVHVHQRGADRAPWYARLWAETSNPLRDRPGAGFSMTKLIAAYYAYWVGASIGVQRGVIATNTLWLALAAIAAAFGKSTFNFLLSKLSLQATTAETVTRIEQTLSIVTPAEKATRALDARIGRGPSGEPLRSNPPIAGATTPAGDL